MALFTYRCPKGHEIEALRHRDVDAVTCPCGDVSVRQAVNRVSVIGQAEVPRDQRNYRKSYGEYREALADVSHHVEAKRRNGEPVAQPDYYGLARAQAKAKGAPIR